VITKDQLYDAYKKSLDRYHKYPEGPRNVCQPEEQADRGGEGVAIEIPTICECCTGISWVGGAGRGADEKCKLSKTYAHR